MPLLQTALLRPPPPNQSHRIRGLLRGCLGSGCWPASSSGIPGPLDLPPQAWALLPSSQEDGLIQRLLAARSWRPGAGGLRGGDFRGPWRGRVWPRAEQRSRLGEDRGRLVPAPPRGPLSSARPEKENTRRADGHWAAPPGESFKMLGPALPPPATGVPRGRFCRAKCARGSWTELPPWGDLACRADVSVHRLGWGGERGEGGHTAPHPHRPQHPQNEGGRGSQSLCCLPSITEGNACPWLPDWPLSRTSQCYSPKPQRPSTAARRARELQRPGQAGTWGAQPRGTGGRTPRKLESHPSPCLSPPLSPS